MKTFIPSQNLILATTVLLVFIVPLRAQDLSQDYLMAHNKAREAVGVSPLMWDYEVASSAEYDAENRMETCYTEISGWQFGENIARGNSSMSGVEAVQMWVNEKVNYDYKSNTCVSKKMCDHYTQVVWNTTQRVGCARVQCKNGQMLVACNYYPAGNLPGERPYLIRETESTI